MKLLKILDIMVILLIIFNFGALLLTNIMVSSTSELKCFHEVNPVTAKINNFKQAPKEESIAFLKLFVTHGFLWAILIGSYLYIRTNYCNNKILYLLTIVLTFLFFIWGWDFFNNLGNFIGMFY